jgi:uncharacterized membrane protein YphA (DoxX/SURF4 family)
MKIAIWLARLLLAAVFLYAGFVKLGASERFAVTVAQFSILPPEWITGFAFALPWIEVAVGLALLTPWTARAGALAAAALLVVFLGALGWAWNQGVTTDCGCFGDTPTSDSPALAMARDAALLAITLLLAWRRTAAADSPSGPSPSTPDISQKTPGNDADL